MTIEKSKSQASKVRWEFCATVATRLNAYTDFIPRTITKNDVHQYLYGEMMEARLIDDVMSGNLEAMEKTVELPGFKRMMDAYNVKPTIHRPNEEGSKQKSERHNEDLENDPAAQLRLAMWFIGKFSSPDKALQVLKAGVSAVKTLSGKVTAD